MRRTEKSKEDFFDAKAKFLRNERVRYENGLPSSHIPEDIVYWERNAEDLAWFLSDSSGDLTASALERAEELFLWMDSNEGKAPRDGSKDPVEKALGSKLSNTKQDKKSNKNGWTTYGSSLLKSAKKRGYPDVFNSRDPISETLEWAEELFLWMDSHEDKLPSKKSKDLIEKSLGSKLSTMRQNQMSNNRGWPIYGSELLKLAKKRDYPDVFNMADLTYNALEWAEELFLWMDSHEGKAPITTAKDPVEKSLGVKLSAMKQIKKNNDRGWTTYGSKLLKLAKKRGYPRVFNRVDLTSEALEWADELFDWMYAHEEKFPSRRSKDPVEKALGIKLSNMRKNKKNNKNGWTTYGSKLLKLAKQRGYPCVFNTGGSKC
ncbi:hypothetical protein LCGC14_0244400 [marine sediment metagenome]|uniref:Uncharacterized protein n=1 Tax=marine sediment metagenome TaxID=412755 RepID=A0A0F9XB31_9ZZZZ